MSETMTPEHLRWREFADRLEGPEGCNFHRSKVDDKIVWTCGGGHSQRFAKAILGTMEGVDVAASLSYFTDHGGHCDCEILFNVDR